MPDNEEFYSRQLDAIRVTRADKLQINPQPLRTVKRKELATEYELMKKYQCQAMTKQGHQCTRTQIANSDFCRQHSGGGIVLCW
jgi:hypothetical protein